MERLRARPIPQEVRTPFAALLTSLFVVSVWWGAQTLQIRQAEDELATQRERALASRADLAQARVRRSKVEELIALDRRIRGIRRSGAVLASRVADLANHIPDRTWLTSIAHAEHGAEIDGETLDVDGLSQTLASLLSSSATSAPSLIQAGRDERARDSDVLRFRVRASTP